MSCLNLNEVRLAGRVVEDIELKVTQSGKSVVSFRVAINRPKRKDHEDQTDFFTVVAWGDRAEFVSKFFGKGSAIYIAGALQSRTWKDNNGNNRSVVEVKADDIRFIDSKKDGGTADEVQYTPKNADFEEIGPDDDLPF